LNLSQNGVVSRHWDGVATPGDFIARLGVPALNAKLLSEIAEFERSGRKRSRRMSQSLPSGELVVNAIQVKI
jgi:hypothetical protein